MYTEINVYIKKKKRKRSKAYVNEYKMLFTEEEPLDFECNREIISC